jgi:hypothetical protein
MLTKILAVSVFTVGLATSAMAQSSYTAHSRHRPVNNEQTMSVDPNTTGSINTYGSASQDYTGAVGPCASDPAGPYGGVRPNVNDQYCGK